MLIDWLIREGNGHIPQIETHRTQFHVKTKQQQKRTVWLTFVALQVTVEQYWMSITTLIHSSSRSLSLGLIRKNERHMCYIKRERAKGPGMQKEAPRRKSQPARLFVKTDGQRVEHSTGSWAILIYQQQYMASLVWSLTFSHPPPLALLYVKRSTAFV